MKITLGEIKESLNQLSEKIDKLTEIVNQSFITTHELEAVAAKIVVETRKEILNHNKIISETLNNIISIVSDPESKEIKPLAGKYSYPNYNVGNEELGSSKNKSSMSWPNDYVKPT